VDDMTENVASRSSYFLVFGGLVLLTLLTVGVSRLPLGAWHTPAGLIIAGCKACLVVLFFMHLIHSTKLTWAVALSGLFWLMILVGLTMSDYLTRDWLGVPGH
jgi:cytochrome c oxidase subunit 4